MEIAVAEIPEGTDAEPDKLLCDDRRRLFRDAEDGKLRLLLMTEARERVRMVNGHPVEVSARDKGVGIEQTDQLAAALGKNHMIGDCSA